MIALVEEFGSVLVEGPGPLVAVLLVASAVVLVPLVARWARLVLGESSAPRVDGVSWGTREVALAFAFGAAFGMLVVSLPGTSVVAGLLKQTLLIASIGVLCVGLVRRSGPDALRAMGFATHGNSRAALFAAGSYVLLLPVSFGGFALWPLIAQAIGIEFEDQEILVGILGLRDAALYIAILFAVIVAPFFEELIFRGFLQPVLMRGFGVVPGVVLTSVVFASAHGASASGAIFMISLVFGWIRVRSGRLTAAWAAHATHNALTLAWVFPSG